MKIFVLTKKNLLIAAAVIVVIILAAVLAIVGGNGDKPAEVMATPEPDSPTSGMQDVDSYEVAVFAGLMKELPVYSVSRDDKKIALTVDAAWADDKTDFILSTLTSMVSKPHSSFAASGLRNTLKRLKPLMLPDTRSATIPRPIRT